MKKWLPTIQQIVKIGIALVPIALVYRALKPYVPAQGQSFVPTL